MTSIFRKLTRRRKPKEQSLQELQPGILTESSQVSERNVEPSTRRPQHLKVTTGDVTSGRRIDHVQPKRRSRSRSIDRSNVAQKNGRSTTPPRGGEQERFERRHVPEAPPILVEGKTKKHLFSFRHGPHISRPHHPASTTTYDSEDETAATSTATTPLKRGRKPPPPAGALPQSVGQNRSQKVKVVRQQKRQLVAIGAKDQVLNSKRTPEALAASKSSTMTTRIPQPGTVPQSASAEEAAKQLALSRETERIARAATALDNRGNDFFEKGLYDKAMDAYTRALKLKRRTFHSMLEEADDLFGDESEENQKMDGNERNVDPKLLVSMATSINNIGYLRQRSGEATPDETMAAYKKSLRIKRKILGNDSLSVGKTLNNIGSVYYLKKEFDGALPAYEEALQIMESNLGNEHPDVATVISNMGDVCLAMKKPEESLARYRTALNIRWNAFGEKDPRTMRLLEKIARIEIGDKMPTPRGNLQERQNYDWDESELYDLDLRPISLELRLLKDQIKEDIEQVDLLEKKIAIGMVRDKVKIVKGMRELLEAQERGHASFGRLESAMSNESSNREDDMDDILYSPGMFATTTESRDDAQARVQERLARLRIQKGLDPAGPRLPFMENTNTQDCQDPPAQLDPSQSKFLRSALYATGTSSRTALSALKPDEIKEKAEDIESALKLKKGIDNLRSSGEIGTTQDDRVTAKLMGKVVTSHPPETSGEKPPECTSIDDVEDKTHSSHQASLDDEVPSDEGVDRSMYQVMNRTFVSSTPNNDDGVLVQDSFVRLTTRSSESFPATKIMYTTWLGEVED